MAAGKMYRNRDVTKKHDNFNLHKKIKEATRRHQRRGRSPRLHLLDSNDNITAETDKKLARWKQYVEELFGDENIGNVPSVMGEEGPYHHTGGSGISRQKTKNQQSSWTRPDSWRSPQTTGPRTDKTVDQPLQQSLHKRSIAK